MKLRWSLFAFLVVVAITVAVPWLSDSARNEVETSRRPKRYGKVMAEEAVVNKHGVYGVDFIRCRRCSVEKLRKGPLTFGGLNVLVLEGLEVVLPPSTNGADTAESAVTPQEVAGRLGMDDGFLKSQGASLKFSGLRIEDLTVSLLRGTNVVRAFSAARGEVIG